MLQVAAGHLLGDLGVVDVVAVTGELVKVTDCGVESIAVVEDGVVDRAMAIQPGWGAGCSSGQASRVITSTSRRYCGIAVRSLRW
ncbi:hypothetical protein AB0D10_37670 [Kitasatospora sp. NPDC048545]|uniref:hypothetical protein n=1 Tax=Kitasatospora sp. NPDC048545 TaxID=3157208 RepID=UPI0033C7EC12